MANAGKNVAGDRAHLALRVTSVRREHEFPHRRAHTPRPVSHRHRLHRTYAPRALELQVTDDGLRISCDPADGEGHGFTGMRERVLMFGGEFSCGPASDGEYVVRAALPV